MGSPMTPRGDVIFIINHARATFRSRARGDATGFVQVLPPSLERTTIMSGAVALPTPPEFSEPATPVVAK